jgi:ATP-dependent DNA helicase DinG
LSYDHQNTVDKFHKNFPFPNLRERQSYVLNEISTGFDSGYKYMVLEAPTGFGKSPVAMAVALALGTSYTCTLTNDLQTQYARDFPFVRVAKGKNNFPCAVKDDFIRSGIYRCARTTTAIITHEHNQQCKHVSTITPSDLKSHDIHYGEDRYFKSSANIQPVQIQYLFLVVEKPQQ